MLEIKPICENCAKPLPNESTDAMICSFECTFCKECVLSICENVCPNCGGGFTPRPTRPKRLLEKYPVGIKPFHKPINETEFQSLRDQFRNIKPEDR